MLQILRMDICGKAYNEIPWKHFFAEEIALMWYHTIGYYIIQKTFSHLKNCSVLVGVKHV